jgi:selenocysteine lyase/cysteine desulfurase
VLSFAALRATEFARLDAQQQAYLDYTGSALYAESQLTAHHEMLRSGLFGNPHSSSKPSAASTSVIDEARTRVLRFFDVDASTHDVIFTANTSAAIKLVAESYPFSRRTACVLSADNHNSVNGIREYAARAGARVRYLPLDSSLCLAPFEDEGPGLFVFPAQSNFSGTRHPLSLVTDAQARGFDVLLDAAAYVPTHALSLRDCPADFAALSFYKLFGYPTGVGALIARRDALGRLRRPWFAGGTVVYASVAGNSHLLRPRHEAFEDGTPNFLAIAALPAGFDLLEAIGMARVTEHVETLTRLLRSHLETLPHVTLYGPANTFNVIGKPYAEIETAARAANIAIRGGCFCNPGASEAAFGYDPARLPPGALRASLGIASNERDVERLVALVSAA